MANNLVKKLLLGAAIIAATFFTSCRLPLINFLPYITKYEISQKDMDPKVFVEFEGGDCNGDGDIYESRVGVDKNGNGALDKYPPDDPRNEVKLKAKSSKITGLMETGYGTFNTIVEIEDLSGAVARTSKTITVNPPPQIFLGGLSVSATEGNIPFELYFSLKEEKTDKAVTKYEVLSFDNVIASSNSPISYEKVTIITAGAYNFYGRYTASDGTTYFSSLQPLQFTAYPLAQNSDVSGTMQFPNAPFNTGEKLSFTGEVDSINPPVTIDTVSYPDSLESKVLNRIAPGISREVFYTKLQNDLKITLNQGGYMVLNQKSDDTLDFTVANARILYNGLDLSIGNSPFIYTTDNLSSVLNEKGIDNTRTDVTYFAGDGSQRTFTLLSSDFEVR